MELHQKKIKRRRIIESKIYMSIINLCEEKEHKGTYKGNAHQLAQELCMRVVEGLLPRQQKKIYATLERIPKTSKEIGMACKLSSRVVSSQLKQIDDSTSLVSSKNKGRIKLWYRYN